MYLKIKKLLSLTIFSLFLYGCATDQSNGPPRLDLSPNILVEESDIGTDFTIQLTVINNMDTNQTSAYGIDNNLKELFLELIGEAFERQDFEVVSSEDRDPEDKVTEIEVTINTVNNQINEQSLSSNIIANAAVTVTAINDKNMVTLTFNSTRTQEVALKPSIQEVTKLTELAVAQVIKRLSISKKILEVATLKQ